MVLRVTFAYCSRDHFDKHDMTRGYRENWVKSMCTSFGEECKCFKISCMHKLYCGHLIHPNLSDIDSPEKILILVLNPINYHCDKKVQPIINFGFFIQNTVHVLPQPCKFENISSIQYSRVHYRLDSDFLGNVE